MTTLQLATAHATLDELEAAFAPRVGDGVVFLPAPCDAPVGEHVSVDVSLASGEVALSFAGLVSWRYPPDAVPLGREAGVGVIVEDVSEEHRARLARMRERSDAGTAARAPGARLTPLTTQAGWLREERVRASPPDERATERVGAASYERFAARTPEEVLREHEVAIALDGDVSVLPVPSPPAGDDEVPPRPTLEGAFFVYEYDEQRRNVGVKVLETFAWPEVGTARPTETDSRFRPPGDTDDDAPSPWDEVTDGERNAPRWEVSDPGSLVTDAVSRALDDVADVDGALRESSREAEAASDEPRAEATGTLPVGLRLRVDDRRPEPLFPAGTSVPASRTVSLSPANGTPHVKVAVFESDREGHGRHLGTAIVRLPPAEDTTSVRFDVREDGFLEVRSLDDGSVSERWRTSWAGPARFPGPEKRRGWRRWFGWLRPQG